MRLRLVENSGTVPCGTSGGTLNNQIQKHAASTSMPSPVHSDTLIPSDVARSS